MKICIVRNFTDERDEGVRIVGREIAMHFQNSELTVKKINIYSTIKIFQIIQFGFSEKKFCNLVDKISENISINLNNYSREE
jgi:hypothetical protein